MSNTRIVVIDGNTIDEITPEELAALLPLPDPQPDPEPIEDTTPPEVVAKSVAPSKSGAIIQVIASEDCEIDVRYGLSDTYELGRESSTELKSQHQIDIKNLQPDTEYHYQIRLEDKFDNVATTEDFTFRTAAEIPDPEPGDHSHYEREKAKPGVVSYASYRTPPGVPWIEEQRVEGRSWDETRNANPGDAHYPVMDSEKDGLKIFVRNGVGAQQTQLRRRFPEQRVKNHVWLQYELMPSREFLEEWDGGFKLTRVEDEEEGVGDKRVLTQNRSAGNGDGTSPIYYRDGEEVWERETDGQGGSKRRAGSDKREVRIWYSDSPPTIDNQPGGDTHVWHNDRDPLNDGKPGFYWSAEKWHRITEHYDFVNGVFEVWAQKEGETTPTKVIEFPVEHWENNPRAGITRCGFWGHSTSGVTGNGVCYWWYRNLIVSGEPIAL